MRDKMSVLLPLPSVCNSPFQKKSFSQSVVILADATRVEIRVPDNVGSAFEHINSGMELGARLMCFC